MPDSTTRTRTRTLTVDGIGPVPVTLTDRGTGRTVLLLHGGGGPLTVEGFAALLAGQGDARVVTPVHPGFGGTPRPDGFGSIRDLAALYVALLDALDVSEVTVVGNSIGGWVTAEIALLASPRVHDVMLVDAVGIEVVGHPVADFFNLSMAEVAELSYHDPDAFRIDPTALPPEQQAAMAANRAALAVYAGTSMIDPTLRGRLGAVAVATRVVWGDADRIGDPDYGRAYAAAIPGATFTLLPETGHLPQLERPELLLALLQQTS